MNQDILKRAMFAMPLSKKARNTGIMQGFEDDMEMVEDDMEMPEQAMEDEGEEMLPMERNPQNPEILMNNLRGDMRSVDARYTELAGMVGEEAAMETPPEVLAILQDHFAMMNQPQGIGALPQGAAMAPPGAMPPPQQPTAQGPAMPQGGMGGQPPFPQGGSEGAPPTPDGLPPAKMAIGGLAARALPYVSAAGAAARGGLSRFNQAANQYLGNMLFRGGAGQRMTSPFLQNARGPGGRYTAQQSVQGGQQVFPTMTQGISQLRAQNPALRAMTTPKAGLIGGTAGLAMYGQSGDDSATGPGLQVRMDANGVPMYAYGKPTESMKAAGDAMFPPMPQIGAGRMPDSQKSGATPTGPAASQPPAPDVPTETPATAEPAMRIPGAGFAGEPGVDNPAAQFIRQYYAAQAGEKPEGDRINRIRKATQEYKDLFKETIGDSDKMNETNAWLMLADAGVKLATEAQPTLAMAIASSLRDLPKGFAQMAADARANDVKISSAALEAAIGDVQAQEDYARQLQLEMQKAQFKAQLEVIKAGKNTGRFELATAGIVHHKNEKGDVVDYSIPVTQDDYKRMGITYNPMLNNMLTSKNTLNAGSPFVEVEEQGSYPAFDKDTRLAAAEGVRNADGVISTVKDMMSLYGEGFGPKSAFIDIANSYFVPFVPGMDPIATQSQAVIQKFKQLQERLTKQIGSAERSGRLSNQQEKWIKEALNLEPAKFFQDKGTVMLTLSNLLTTTINDRQSELGTLIPLRQTYRVSRIPTGLEDDPFDLTGPNRTGVIDFMKSVAKKADPETLIYAQIPGVGIRPLKAGNADKWNITR